MKPQLQAIFLAKSQFERSRKADFESKDIKHGLSINIETNIIDQIPGLVVSFDLEFIVYSKRKANFLIKYKSTHIAHLKIDDINDQDEDKLDRFGGVNVAAMIFPFIREDIANRVGKSGLTPIFLPPINFIEEYEKKKQKAKLK
ncbi:TPA: protein-export chaperone SecB [Elizabethkingia anophelis]|nr:hypothetical protein [Elizabethkingia anophelis]HBN6702171.1 protein-export chaperone SecB [Elizabethkingia anophelis]HBN6706296.1 protein-export chaperone SecB [Elizabethkingia anophelis]HBN6710328.1 protein-export chaperone SecB [Elizabethkingia anophelis]HBN6713125.1 protein-export chaperone SecB [Elizabethkingia anophelis]